MAIDEKKLIEYLEDRQRRFPFLQTESARMVMKKVFEYINKQPKLSLEKFQATKTSDKWIPCSERLPKKEGWYYVTLESRFDGHRCTDWVSYYHGWSYASGDVVAWVENPEPYKGEEK